MDFINSGKSAGNSIFVLLGTSDFSAIKDLLHNFCETVTRGSRWAARRLFAANSPPIGKKNNEAERPSPRDRRLQRVMQRVVNGRLCARIIVALLNGNQPPISTYY